MEIKRFYQQNPPQPAERKAIAHFLHEHLETYGDPIEDIEKCISYAMGEEGRPGGFILSCLKDEQIACAVIVNKTGMSGFIPENILVYIATHRDFRGKGIGKEMMQEAIQTAEGDMALHVEPENPARKLYENLGFTNKYLEMRYKKEK